VRAAACRALAQTGAAEVAPLLAERLRAGEAVGRRLPPRRSPSCRPRRWASWSHAWRPTLRRADRPRARGPRRGRTGCSSRILELVGSRSIELRRAAPRGRAAGGSRAEVALIRALADRDLPVQLEALELLVRRAGPRPKRPSWRCWGARLAPLSRDPRAGAPGRGQAAGRLWPVPVRALRAGGDRVGAHPDRPARSGGISRRPAGRRRPRSGGSPHTASPSWRIRPGWPCCSRWPATTTGTCATRRPAASASWVSTRAAPAPHPGAGCRAGRRPHRPEGAGPAAAVAIPA
jgi:hypothetical protein